ncbi:MAG: hypothetical protein KGD68_00990 [Candidatus Lokiarchaeota archaeon]|nr:hypothetical protein [Candidatus Lokiarchaeota archaeon]
MASTFIFSMLLVNIWIFSDFNIDIDNNQQDNWSNDEINILTSDTDPYLTDYYISGTGDNQEVRIYALNNSFSNDNNQNSFNIPSMSTTESTYLTYGNFNFTFQNNFTTDYFIEDTNALEADDFIKFVYNEDTSSMSINNGSILDPIIFDNLIDGLPSTYIRLESSGGILNFTISSNFTSTIYDGTLFDVDFNRSLILGLISKFSSSLNNSAFLTLKMLDISDSTWINVTDRMFINYSLGTQLFEDRFVNENLNYINTSDVSQIQFYLQRYDSTDFILTLEEFELASTYGFDLPITSSNQVALEFDLKGESSSVNGFYAWIRTLNLTQALNAELNITLYEANATIARSPAYLTEVNLEPDTTKLIDTQIIDYNDYHGDSLSYFEFNLANTQNLSLSNYFIVIKSNRSEQVFSLVTMPQQTYGDPETIVDHQLRTSSNSGFTWNLAIKQVLTTTSPYNSEILDAAAFKLNVTRAYMPSDFTNPYDSQDTLKIQDIPIINQINNDPPYDTSSSLKWGLGQWDYNFTTSITNNSLNNFQIDLTWNNSIIQGFNFNVTYMVKAYWIEQANSVYQVSYDTTPIWELNYTMNTGYKNFDNWNLLEFWYLFPSDYTAKNLTNPNFVEIYEDIVNKTGGEQVLPNQPSYEYISVPNDLIGGISGVYSLNLTSSNLIYDMNSYINYKDILWETNGFMYGDNISIKLDIRDPNSNAPISGNANVVLFYPNNSTKVPGVELNSGSGVITGNSLVYDFNNQSIYDVTNDIPVLGNYYLGFFWENGSAIGCQKLKLYIDKYDVEMNDLIFEPTLNQNILDGIVDKVYEEYSILISTVNVTDDKYYPSFYAVNKTDINQEFIYTIGEEEIPIVIESFLQNETILNPNENIRISARIQNKHDFVEIKLRLNVQLVSLANQEWVIAEQTTDLKTLKPSIDPNGEDTQEFSVDITMPTLLGDGNWHGVNAPIRKGGAKTIFTVFIEYGGESFEIDTFESNEYSLIINSTEDVFEGYIIALKSNNDITGASIVKPFERDECQYLPNQTTFIINIYDRNYVSSYNQFIESFSLKINSDFSEIQTLPQTPNYGQLFNISSILITEFGDIIPNKNVSCQFYDSGIWETLSTQISDMNGITDFEIDTSSLPSDDQFKFRLTWQGDQYTLENSRNVTVLMYRAFNAISLRLRSNVEQIYRNAQITIQLTLSNIGDSELRVIVPNISIGILPSLTYSIVEIDYLALEKFKPGDITVILIKIDIPAIDQINVSVSIGLKNDITDEELTFQISKLFDIYDVLLVDYLLNLFTLIMVFIFVLVWGIMLFYVKRTIKRIETPFEEPEKRKQRKGRYVSVSELPKEEIPEAQPTEDTEKKTKKRLKKKKPEAEKKDKSLATDLDSLLEEKGLKD